MALGAMKARWYVTMWYAAIWKAGAVLALKELLDCDDGKELPLLVAGPSLIDTQAVRDERAEGVASATRFCGKKAVHSTTKLRRACWCKTDFFDVE